MTRRGALGWLGGGTALALGGCGLRRTSEELRYRLTISVDTPEGERRGSSVIAIRGVKNPDWVNIEGRGTRASFMGEAAAVDLPGGRTLFALLRTAGAASDAADYPFLAFEDSLQDSPGLLESMQRLRSWKGHAASMPRAEHIIVNGGKEVSALPELVTFRDLKRPASVEQVDPRDLAAVFGAGTALKGLTITVTDADLTIGIETRLPWLGQHPETRLDSDFPPTTRSLDLAQTLRHGDFRRTKMR